MLSQLVHTGRWHTVVEMAYGRRSAPTVAPAPYTVRFDVLADESHEYPLFTLPEGWQDMTPVEIGQWATAEALRTGRKHLAEATEPSGQDAPKGSYEDPWDVYEYDIPDGFSILTVLDTVEPDRRPGDGWFGGARPGALSTYRDDELAASQVVYYEGEPVLPEQPAVAWDAYPASWDVPVQSTVHNPRYDKPRLKEGDRPVLPPSPENGGDDGDWLPMWWCGEFQTWSPVLHEGDTGMTVCLECDAYIQGPSEWPHCPGMTVEVAL